MFLRLNIIFGIEIQCQEFKEESGFLGNEFLKDKKIA